MHALAAPATRAAVTPARADASQPMGRGFTCMRACMQDLLVCARWVVLLRVGGDHRDPGEALQRRLPARRQRTLRQVPPVCAPPSLHLLRMRRTPAHMSAHTRVVATRGVGCDDSSHPKLARATARRMATAIARPVISAELRAVRSHLTRLGGTAAEMPRVCMHAAEA